MASVIIGDADTVNLSTNDRLRQGTEVSRPEYLRGTNSPNVTTLTRASLVTTGSVEPISRKQFFDDTVVEPKTVSGGNLALATTRVRTVIVHDRDRRDFGFSSNDSGGANESTPFIDTIKFSPSSFVAAGDARYPMSDAATNQDFENPYRLNGILEPLSIRPKASLSSIETPYESHDVWGTVESMHAQVFDRSCNPIGFLIPFEGERITIDPYQDEYPILLAEGTGSMPDVGIVDAQPSPLGSFVDFSDKELNAGRYVDSGISSVIVTGVTGSTDVYPPLDHYLATAGYQPSMTQLRRRRNVGVDSIAYVGLER
jgi:hypothetical protein